MADVAIVENILNLLGGLFSQASQCGQERLLL